MPRLLIDYYKAIEDGSHRMLEAARAKDLDTLMQLEGVCIMLIDQLRTRSLDEELEPQELSEKARIMQRILRNDAEIRQLTEPWLGQIEVLMSLNHRVLH